MYGKIKDDAIWLAKSNGNVRFWLDNWLGFVNADRIGIPAGFLHLYQQRISDYYVNGVWQLAEDFCYNQWDIVQRVVDYQFRPDSDSDEVIWRHSAKGDASAKGFYHHFRDTCPTVD